MNDNSDISYDSDEESFAVRPSLQDDYYNTSANETADSFKQNMNFECDEDYLDAAKIMGEFYRQQLCLPKETKQSERRRFENHRLFEIQRDRMRVARAVPNLFFLPTVVVIERRQDELIKLRNRIMQEIGNMASVLSPKDKQNQIHVTIHNQRELSFYIIRFQALKLDHPHKKPQLLDIDLSINPLFRFYQDICDQDFKFSQACGLLLYWAYQKGILASDFMPETALKLIMMCFYFNMGHGIPHIVYSFIREKEKILNSLRCMYRVNKKKQCILDDDLFDYQNFSLREKRGFYDEATKKFIFYKQILPVPFPVEEKDVQRFKNQVKMNEGKTSKNQFHGFLIFINLIQYLDRAIKRSERLVIDFTKSRKSIELHPDMDFNIEVKHPVFMHNICEKLTKDPMKILKLKQEIGNVLKAYNTSRDRPLTAVCKIFERS